jgi:hypothetical protein
MDPLHNPFSPGAGTPPPELAGRKDVLPHQKRHDLQPKTWRHSFHRAVI